MAGLMKAVAVAVANSDSTFGDTIKSHVRTAKSILDQYGFKASFSITCGISSDSSKNGVQRNIGMPRMSLE